jgi:hypothetical protein
MEDGKENGMAAKVEAKRMVKRKVQDCKIKI